MTRGSGRDGEEGLCEVKLEPRAKPQKTREGQRKGSAGPCGERSLCWSRAGGKAGPAGAEEGGEQYRMSRTAEGQPRRTELGMSSKGGARPAEDFRPGCNML